MGNSPESISDDKDTGGGPSRGSHIEEGGPIALGRRNLLAGLEGLLGNAASAGLGSPSVFSEENSGHGKRYR